MLTISGRISGVAFDSRIAVTKHLVLADPAVYVSGSAPDATEITYKCMSHITAGNIMRALRGDQLEDVVPIGAADADPEAIKRAGNTEVAALKLMK